MASVSSTYSTPWGTLAGTIQIPTRADQFRRLAGGATKPAFKDKQDLLSLMMVKRRGGPFLGVDLSHHHSIRAHKSRK